MKKVKYKDLGKISYQDALKIQLESQKELTDRKIRIRDGINLVESELIHDLYFCEHLPVYTLGRSGSIDNLLFNEQDLKNNKIEFYKTNRGGDITYHGLGQIVGYPIFDLDEFYHDVHRYVRDIEEVIIRTLKDFNIISQRIDGLTGVWIKGVANKPDRKICAIGIHMSRWVTLHGFALNVNTDLNYFKGIVPCGIQQEDKTVTSMKQELDKEISLNDVKMSLIKYFKVVFECDIS